MRFWFAVVVLGLPFAAVAGPDDDAKKDQEGLQGTWQIVALDIEGKPATKDELNEVQGNKLTIKGDKFSHAIQGTPFEATFSLDSTKTPKLFDLTATTGSEKGKKLPGIYSLEGDALKICFDMAGRDRPADFKGGKTVVLMVFKRDKP